ncbi:hypothetical protein Pfo_028276 [Paulownia fortunei]|nr:hypothetical protein Pfo_028276 [Paulownia fortunei]
MDRMLCPALFITCLLFYSQFIAVNADEAEVEDESTFTYGGQTEKGPENWANLNPKWKACGNGRLQSPIDLIDDRVVVLSALGDLKRTYKPAPAIIRNRGHDITVVWEGDAGGVVINGTEYKLLQCHWHTPAEHTVDGKDSLCRFKMEIHMVHNNSLGQISVVGIMYKLGRPDPFLAKLVQNIKTVNHEGTNLGSSPCTEDIIWTILKKVRTVSREQIRALRNAVHDGFEDNARPTQHSDEIDVYMYRPGNQ